MPDAMERRTGRLHTRWEQLCAAMENPDFELTIEDFAPVLCTFKALRRAGVEFERGMAALMRVLERQCFGRDDDTDRDADESRESRAA